MDIANKIKQFRKEEKLTQAELAGLLNVSRQTISAWENGRALPDVEMLAGISDALHRNMQCFFGAPQGNDEQRYSCIKMIDNLRGTTDVTTYAWQNDMPSGSDYQGGLYVGGASLRFDKNGAERDGLAVTVKCEEQDGIYYNIPYLKNVGTVNSGQITLLRSLDILLPETNIVFETINGDDANGYSSSFFPVYKELKTGDSVKMCADSGRPSERVFPFFTVRYGTVKLLFAIGWAGRWNYEIHVTQSGTRITAGLPDADFYLKPGEEIRLPSIVCVAGTGEDVYTRLRAFIRNKTKAFTQGRYLPISAAPFDRYFWDNPNHNCFTYEGQKHVVDVMNKIGSFDTLWLDAAWFKDAPTFPGGVGNYSVRDVFNYSLKPVSDYAHSFGYKFIVWFEIERVCAGTEIYNAHPEYMLKGTDDFTFLYNLSMPEAVHYLAGLLLDTLDKNGIDILRIDYNIWPLSFWRRHDEPGRKNFTEIGCVAGWYALLDEIHAAKPDLFIDNCASGGRRLDIESIIRTVPLWRSDMGCHPDTETNRVTVWKQNCTLGLSKYLPFQCSGSWDPTGYECRCGCTSGAVCAFPFMDDTIDIEQAKKAVAELKHLRDYWLGDFYALTPATLDETVWTVYRLAKDGNGVFYLFRREQSLNDTMIISVPEAQDRQYRITVSDELYNTTEYTVDGKELRLGIKVVIPKKKQSATVEYIAL